MTKSAIQTVEEANDLMRTERQRISTIVKALDSLQTAARNVQKTGELAQEAGEILINSEIIVIEEQIGNIAAKLWDARKRKTHAELDEMMNQAVSEQR